MKIIIYILSTLFAWLISQKMIDYHINDLKNYTFNKKTYKTKKLYLKFIQFFNPMFWGIYIWHISQISLVFVSNFLYYSCPIIWLSSINILLTKLLWNSKKFHLLFNKIIKN
jgi:hypothetical protein